MTDYLPGDKVKTKDTSGLGELKRNWPGTVCTSDGDEIRIHWKHDDTPSVYSRAWCDEWTRNLSAEKRAGRMAKRSDDAADYIETKLNAALRSADDFCTERLADPESWTDVHLAKVRGLQVQVQELRLWMASHPL